MKYSLQWIKQFAELPADLNINEFADKMWRGLAEIEQVENLGEQYKGVVIAKILKVENHPKSEKLLVTEIDAGQKEPITVVTGAHNIKAGDYVPYIPVGVYVPNREKIAEPLAAKPMAGITSYGMIASMWELNLGEDHSGIMIINPEELDNKIKPGDDFATALGLNDHMLEIENKAMTHRGDCFSITGISREVSAIMDVPYKSPQWLDLNAQQIADYATEFTEVAPNRITLKVTAESGVPRYSAIVLDNITVTESPLWLKLVLIKHGIKPINNVVDITNYIMLEMGQPLHAFDASQVAHSVNNGIAEYEIHVRRANAAEKLYALDNKEHTLSQENIVIADENKVLGVAGIIGGMESAVTANTHKIILESATFDMYATRKSSMLLGIFTDAATVFSRRQDPNKTVKAMLRAIDFLQKYAGAKIASHIADNYPTVETERTVVISTEKTKTFLGIDVSSSAIKTILERLNFDVIIKGDLVEVTVPTYRTDIQIDEDIYEEIVRIYGYGSMAVVLPTRPVFAVPKTDAEKIKEKVTSYLTGKGFLESFNFTFISKDLYDDCGISVEDCHQVINAISPDVQYIRKLVSPGLIQQSVHNQYNKDSFGLFEYGHVMRKGKEYGANGQDAVNDVPPTFGTDDTNLPIENQHIAITITSEDKSPVYYQVKQYMDELFNTIGISDVRYIHIDELSEKEQKELPVWIADAQKPLKSGRTAIIQSEVSGQWHTLGIIGEVSSYVARNIGAKKNIGVVELHMYALSRVAINEIKYQEPSKYPSVVADYCFEVTKSIKYSDIIGTLQKQVFKLSELGENIIEAIDFVDIYAKSEDKKQVTVRVTYQSYERTLVDKEVKEVQEKLVQTIIKTFDAKLV
jgi:phenylalanyl-tRNA synthetase beta chain